MGGSDEPSNKSKHMKSVDERNLLKERRNKFPGSVLSCILWVVGVVLC